jgi:MFS family permease
MSAFVVVLITAGFSDRIKARGPFMIAGCIVAIAGYTMLLASNKNAVKYGGTFLVATGVFQGSPMGKPFASCSVKVLICVVMGWLSNNSSPHYVRATASGFQIAFANCAAFVATFSYLKKDAWVPPISSKQR